MRRFLLPVLVATAASIAYGWSELGDYLWTDYEYANEGPLRALVHGQVLTFLQTAPIEGPSLLLRAPFALGAWIWGAGDMAIFRMVALPGLIAGATLGVVLGAARERLQPGAGWGLIVVALAAGNPLALRALSMGHPEELLGAALGVGAVLAAVRQRPDLAAVLLGLALANKAWAVLAIGPVLLALPDRRVRALTIAGGIAVAFVAPFLLAGGAGRAAVLSAGDTDAVFQPWQLWWPLGDHGQVVRGMDGVVKEDFRAAPGWLAPITHPLIAVLVVPASLLWARRRRDAPGSADVLLLLALLLFARCVLDVANNVYYHLPFAIALLAWEALQRSRPPVLSIVAVCLVWATVEVAPSHVSPDVQWALYTAWALPALILLAGAAFGIGARPSLAQAWRPLGRAGSLSR